LQQTLCDKEHKALLPRIHGDRCWALCRNKCCFLHLSNDRIGSKVKKKFKKILKIKFIKIKIFYFFRSFFPLPLPIPRMTMRGGRSRNFSGCSNLPSISEAPSRAERGSRVESLSSYFLPFFGPSRQTPPQETRNWSSCWPLPVLLARIFLTKNSSLKIKLKFKIKIHKN